MKRVILPFLSLLILPASFACTTFCINQNGQIVFGRNYDWVSGTGIVYTNQRGLFKISKETEDGPTGNWISKYGSITFNQYGKEFPTGGMNEKGLVVEMMWLDGTQYAAKDKRPSLMILQWMQYQLDNSATVEEVIATDATVRVSGTDAPLHYLIADANGRVATIEYLNGKMVVHKGRDLSFPVLTNNTYESSAEAANAQLKQNKQVSLNDNSLERFVKACGMIQQLQDSAIKLPLTDYAFSILDKVSQGDFTKWSIVYDISNKKIFFKTNGYISVKSVSFSDFDFSCNTPSRMFNMNQEGKGAVSSKFTLHDAKLKRKLAEKVVAESMSRFTISDKGKEDMLTYSDAIKCKE